MAVTAARALAPDPVPAALRDFLGAPTPEAWVTAAAEHLDVLLVDHANCERKAAASALALMTRYADRPTLAARMSRLAREELRHFEQVQKILRERGIARRRVSASRYAAGLRAELASTEPWRLVDQLLIGAFIEARSCERFALLAPRLEPALGRFYQGLLAAEARHFRHYLELANRYRDRLTERDVDRRVDALRAVENRLVTTPDPHYRFHSGPPAAGAQRGSESSA